MTRTGPANHTAVMPVSHWHGVAARGPARCDRRLAVQSESRLTGIGKPRRGSLAARNLTFPALVSGKTEIIALQ